MLFFFSVYVNMISDRIFARIFNIQGKYLQQTACSWCIRNSFVDFPNNYKILKSRYLRKIDIEKTQFFVYINI